MINGMVDLTLFAANKAYNVIKNLNLVSEKNKNADDNQTSMELIAHRGYSLIAPENTLPAFEAAVENGYDTVECDLDWTKDGIPVLLHDQNLERTSNIKWWMCLFGFDKCKNNTFKQLRQYDFGSWKGDEFKGTKIPSFSEALDYAKDNDLNLYLELKEEKGFTIERAKALVEQIVKEGMENKVTWISSNSLYLKIMSEIMPDSRLGYIVKDEPNEDTIETLEWLQNCNNEVFLDVKASKMTESADQLLDDAGFEFEAWTVDDIEILKLMESYGCQGITTNAITQKDLDEYYSEFK